jgi:pimeloyl-ACP methyl ester carboxylesterase
MKTEASAANRERLLHPADIRGLARLGFDAAVGITNLVEAMHHTIASRGGIVGSAPKGRTRGITGLVYGTVRGSTRLVGRGLDAALGAVTPLIAGAASTPERDAIVAVLNGLWGDHLAATHNPLAIKMALRVDGEPLDLTSEALAARLPQATGKLLVLVHGLCMNDLQWTREGHNHGRALAHDLGYTPVWLHYNSGRHVSENGREFAELLERLVAAWPVPVEELTIVAHSMGGLVARSACRLAEGSAQRWRAALKRNVFLGTPHHGAPLERGGQQLDMLLGISPYVAPFTRLGRARSAGITDLRFGNLQDADWQGRDRHAQRRDDRAPVPLPAGVEAYMIAATLAGKAGGINDAMVGDGLVPLGSALGEHDDPRYALVVPKEHQHIVTSANHWDLLERPAVYSQLRTWLA